MVFVKSCYDELPSEKEPVVPMSRSERVRVFRFASIACALGTGLLLCVYLCAEWLGISPEAARWCFMASIALFALAITCRIAHVSNKKCTRGKGKPCVNCGYDLRGNTSGICPECGGLAHYKRSHP